MTAYASRAWKFVSDYLFAFAAFFLCLSGGIIYKVSDDWVGAIISTILWGVALAFMELKGNARAKSEHAETLTRFFLNGGHSSINVTIDRNYD